MRTKKTKNLLARTAKAFGISAAMLCAGVSLAVNVPGMALQAAEVEEELDYILGRPMTGEEIEAQKALIPKTFPEAPELVQSPSVEEPSHKERVILPSSYDPRGLGFLTPASDQGKWGNCWAHTAVAAAEASMVKKGISDVNSADLSEWHLSYFVYHMPEDPLGNAVGDGTYLDSNSESYLEIGGNDKLATHALANWVGFADESIAPYENTRPYDYSDNRLPENLNETLAYQDRVHLANSHWIAATDMEDIKRMVMEMGSASVGLSFDGFDDNYNIETGAFFSPRRGNSAHAGLVVGWDDNYSARNFLAGRRPSSDGAWLVKNTWGQNFGDGGYYWISYEDAGLSTCDFTFYDVESADNYDHNYYYDGSLGLYYMSMASGSSIANVYTAKASRTGAEVLEAVSLAMYSTNVNYAIQIYKDVTDDKDPESGTPVFAVPQTGTITYSGYHTIPLIQPVSMVEGCRFSIVITLTKTSGGFITCATDLTEHDERGIHFITSEFPGQSFCKLKGYRWRDSTTEEKPYTMRVKGFTSDTTPVPVSSISMAESSFTMVKTETKKLFVGYAPANATDTRLTWKSSNSAVAKVGADGTVTAVGDGTCTVTATAANGATASCQVTVHTPQNLQISKTSATLYQGETLTLRATGVSAKTVWSSSAPSVVAVSANGKLTAKKVGSAVISVTAGGQKKTCRVTVKTVLKVSQSSISLKKGKKKSVVVTFFKEGEVRFKIKNAKYVSCSWGEFNRDKIKLTIRGLKKGKTTVEITNTFNKEKKIITVKVG